MPIFFSFLRILQTKDLRTQFQAKITRYFFAGWEIDPPYFSFENFKIFLRQLKEKAFSICYLNIRSLSNIFRT